MQKHGDHPICFVFNMFADTKAVNGGREAQDQAQQNGDSGEENDGKEDKTTNQ